MHPAGNIVHKHRLRWVLALLGWACWFVAVFSPISAPPAQPLINLYTDTLKSYRLVDIVRAPFGIQAAVHLFAVATIVLALSPVFMLLLNRAWVARVRWLGWLLVGIAPMLSWVIARFGSIPAFYLLALSHLLICAAIVRWPGEAEPEVRGFDVMPAESPEAKAPLK